MPSIWDMLFPGGGPAPQFADPNGNPNAQLPVPFPGPQQAPWLPQTTPWPQDAAPLTAQQRYRASQAGDESRLPQYERSGPTLPVGLWNNLVETATRVQTPPPQLPPGVTDTDFAGLAVKRDGQWVPWKEADPQAAGAYYEEMQKRADLPMNVAMGMVGGGTAFAPKVGALGTAGAKMLQPAAEATEAAQPGIRAYHSSPHDFTQFDLSKVGTGEGAQAYGHGIYVAENPAVSGQGGEYWNQFKNKFEGPERWAAEYLQKAGFDREEALKLLKTQAWPPNSPSVLGAEELLKSGQPVGPRTYEVNIGAHPEHFLDWDKPLSQQHPSVQEAVRKLPGFKEELAAFTRGKNVEAMAGDTAAEATQALQQAGIPGIRYLDQGSRRLSDADIHDEIAQIMKDEETARKYGQRAAPQALGPTKANEAIERLRSQLGQPQTSNYVVFDPKMIEILKKYGIAGMLGGGGAAASQLPIPPQKAPVF